MKRVKIIKCSRPSSCCFSWYQNMIGKEFNITDETEEEYIVNYEDNAIHMCIWFCSILKEDCEEIIQ